MKKIAPLFLCLSLLLPGLVLAKTGSKDKTPPVLHTVQIQTDAPDRASILPGSRVSITFTTTEPVKSPTIKVGDKNQYMTVSGTSTSWTASYIVGADGDGDEHKYGVHLHDDDDNDSSETVHTDTDDSHTAVVVKAMFATSTFNAVTQSAAGFTVTGPTTKVSKVVYTITDAFGHSLSGVGTTTNGIFTGVANLSVLNGGTVQLTASLYKVVTNTCGTTTVGTAGATALKDATPPTIAPVSTLTFQAASSTGLVVSYGIPTAYDVQSGTSTVSCSPLPGYLFPVGTTTVNCFTQDVAGNSSTSSFQVVILAPTNNNGGGNLPPGTPFVIASQPDESFLCQNDWNDCFASSSQKVIPLGSGVILQHGSSTIKSLTIAKDEMSPYVSQQWTASIVCYTDAAYTTLCPDWTAPTPWNGNVGYYMTENTLTTTDNKHWTADFTDNTHELNADGSSPMRFKTNYYYQLVINDNGWIIGAYGSDILKQPYWVLMGISQ